MIEILRRRRGLMGGQYGPKILYTLSESDMARKTGATGTYPYYGTVNTRISYVEFDLLLSGGKKYTFNAISTTGAGQMALHFSTQTTMDSVANHASIVGTFYNTGWLGLEETVDVPEVYNGSPIVNVRLTFRQAASNPTISDDFAITSVTIEEVPV